MRPIKHINWMDLSGLLVGVFLTFALMVFGITLYAKLFTSGVIGVEEYHLTSRFDKALGLSEGTKVQISGVVVGRISEIALESQGVKIKFTIRKQYQNWITDSATVFAIRDQNVISSRVINIDVHRGGRVLQDGDSIQSGQAQDLEQVLETANDLLKRVGELVDVADTIVSLVMDTGTTLGALLGSRALYDNLNTQLGRLDKITNVGINVLYELDGHLPMLLSRSDSLLTDLQNLTGGVQNVPTRLNGMFDTMDNMFGRLDTMMTKFDGVASSLTGLVDAGGQTLENADDLMQGLSNMWIIRRSLPTNDSVPFTVENLW